MERLADASKFIESPSAQPVLVELEQLIGAQARDADTAMGLKAIDSLAQKNRPLAAAMVVGLKEGLSRSGSPLKDRLGEHSKQAAALLAELIQNARQTAGDEAAPAAARAAAIRTLAMGAYQENRELLPGLLGTRQPQEVQLATLATMARYSDPEVGAVLTEAWPSLGPKIRAAAIETLFSRGEWLLKFLEAVEKEEIAASDLDPARIRQLEKHGQQSVREKAAAVLKKMNLGRRQDVVQAYQPALALKGDVAHGKQHFQKVCAVCHRLDNFGTEIGPNLATLQNRGAETILLNVLDPNREVNPLYVNYVLVTTEGRSLTGLVAAETATSVTLKRQENATDTVLRANIEELRSTGMSIMPEGLEKQLDQQALADLIAYLLSVK